MINAAFTLALAGLAFCLAMLWQPRDPFTALAIPIIIGASLAAVFASNRWRF